MGQNRVSDAFNTTRNALLFVLRMRAQASANGSEGPSSKWVIDKPGETGRRGAEVPLPRAATSDKQRASATRFRVKATRPADTTPIRRVPGKPPPRKG